jgi:MFS transporter, OPA family, glycerol-3-phosphate transporter
MFVISAVCLAAVTAFISLTPSKAAGEAIGTGEIITAVFNTLLLALSSAAMLGANTMLLTYIPLHYGKAGLASSVSGMLDCFSYAAAAVSNIAVGAVSENLGWTNVFYLFVGCAIVGAVIAAIGHGKMKKTTDELDRM